MFSECADGAHSAEYDQLERALHKLGGGLFIIAYASTDSDYSKDHLIRACLFSEAEDDLGTRVIDALWENPHIRRGYIDNLLANMNPSRDRSKPIDYSQSQNRRELAQTFTATLGGDISRESDDDAAIQICGTHGSALPTRKTMGPTELNALQLEDVEVLIASETLFNAICSFFNNPQELFKVPQILDLRKSLQHEGKSNVLGNAFREDLRKNPKKRSEFVELCVEASIALFNSTNNQHLYDELTEEQKVKFAERIDECLLGTPAWSDEKFWMVSDIPSMKTKPPPTEHPQSKMHQNERKGYGFGL